MNSKMNGMASASASAIIYYSILFCPMTIVHNSSILYSDETITVTTDLDMMNR